MKVKDQLFYVYSAVNIMIGSAEVKTKVNAVMKSKLTTIIDKVCMYAPVGIW